MKNLLKIVTKPKFLIITWFIFLLSPLLSVFRYFFVVKNPIFGLHIKGLSTLLFYFPFIISLIVSFVLFYWFKEFIDKEIPRTHKKTLTVLSLLSAVFLIFARILLDMEHNNFPNFLYSNYGITVVQLELMSFIAAIEILICLSILAYSTNFRINNAGNVKKIVDKRKSHTLRSSKVDRAAFYLAIAGFSGLLVLSANTFLNWRALSSGEEGGFETRIGRHYKYLDSLTNHTPMKARIIHPPQGDKWPAIGNQPVIRYFLFPRTLISGILLDNQEIATEFKEAYFVEIDPSSQETHWPIIDMFGKTVIFDEKNEVKYNTLETVFESEGISVYKIIF